MPVFFKVTFYKMMVSHLRHFHQRIVSCNVAMHTKSLLSVRYKIKVRVFIANIEYTRSESLWLTNLRSYFLYEGEED